MLQARGRDNADIDRQYLACREIQYCPYYLPPLPSAATYIEGHSLLK